MAAAHHGEDATRRACLRELEEWPAGETSKWTDPRVVRSDDAGTDGDASGEDEATHFEDGSSREARALPALMIDE